jgi:hypothetical protein
MSPRLIRLTLICSLSLFAAALTFGVSSASASSGHNACLASAHPAKCDITTTIVKKTIASGKATECQVLGDGALSCWGNNSDGQAVAPNGKTFASVALGGYHGCAIKTDNTITCWGDNHFRQATVGGGKCSPSYAESTPNRICPEPATGPYGLHAIDISAGKFHTCAVLTTRIIECWGLNVDMNGSPAGQADPPGGSFTSVTAGGYHTCALATDTSIKCWGASWDHISDAPTGTGFKQIAAGRTHTCALKNDGSIVCWGLSTNGRATPPAGTGYKAIASGYDNSCAIKADNSIVCWGANNLGQLNTPTGSFTSISLGGNSGIAQRSDGVVVGWGDSSDGQAAVPTGASIGGPTVSLGIIHGLGKGKWTVSIYSKAGSKPNSKVQVSSSKDQPSDAASTAGAIAFKSKFNWSGTRPTWVRISDSIRRWSAWVPIQPQLAS